MRRFLAHCGFLSVVAVFYYLCARIAGCPHDIAAAVAIVVSSRYAAPRNL